VSGVETWAIIPVKALRDAKQRLAPVLPPATRARLVLTMLEDVLGALVHVHGIARTIVVTPDGRVADTARRNGAETVREARARGLNAAVRTGLAHGMANGATRALVLPADVPLATPAEIASVLAATEATGRPRVTLVPSGDGEGTNALLLTPPDALEPEFGIGSFVRHLASAVARRLDTQVLQLPGLGADIDEPRDLIRLAGRERYAFLRPHLPVPIGPESNPLQGPKP
jgi:2-phospho-L-lactate guanylyltransferase